MRLFKSLRNVGLALAVSKLAIGCSDGPIVEGAISLCSDSRIITVGSSPEEKTKSLVMKHDEKFSLGNGKLLELRDISTTSQAIFAIVDEKTKEDLDVFTKDNGETFIIRLNGGESITISVCSINDGYTFGERSVKVATSETLAPYKEPIQEDPKLADPLAACKKEAIKSWIKATISLGEILNFEKPVSGEGSQKVQYQIILDDLEVHGGFTSAILSILDPTFKVLSKVNIASGETRLFGEYGFALGVDEIAAGYTFGAKWAKITVTSCDGGNLTFLKPVPATDTIAHVPSFGSLPALGSSDAPITIIHFGNFEGPFDAKFAAETLPILEATEIGAGKVKFYYRTGDIPVLFSKTDLTSNAAQCANEQGKFWEFYKELFSTQMKWMAADTLDGSIAYFVDSIGLGLGLNKAQLLECITEMRYQALVDNDKTDLTNLAGDSFGIPFFVFVFPKTGTDKNKLFQAVNGAGTVLESENNLVVFYPGAQPYANFNSIIGSFTP